MATNTLEFTLKDGSSQILDLSVLANILYIDLYMGNDPISSEYRIFGFHEKQ